MNNKEMLEAIAQMIANQEQKLSAMMDQKLDQKLQPIIEQLNSLEESQEETRNGVNTLLEWADKCEPPPVK